jgi:ATP-dependent DNA helicase RecG
MTADEVRGMIAAGETLDARGERKGRAYHLSAVTYRRLGDKAGYIRQRGFEPIQREQMVMQYVEKHGSISRADVADLCHLSGPQAFRLLQALARKGLLALDRPRGRGARYVRKAK